MTKIMAVRFGLFFFFLDVLPTLLDRPRPPRWKAAVAQAWLKPPAERLVPGPVGSGQSAEGQFAANHRTREPDVCFFVDSGKILHGKYHPFFKLS